jgi:hypothetical protein
MARSSTDTLTAAMQAQAHDSERNREAWNLPRATGKPASRAASGGAASLMSGRFEAQFPDEETARAAARDARAVGFTVEVRRVTAWSWVTVGRRKLPFPSDERDRYASRAHAIATQHGGAFSRFVEEPPGIGDDRPA